MEARVDFSRRNSRGRGSRSPSSCGKKAPLRTRIPSRSGSNPSRYPSKSRRRPGRASRSFPASEAFPSAGFGIEQYFVNPAKIDVEGPKEQARESRLDPDGGNRPFRKTGEFFHPGEARPGTTRSFHFPMGTRSSFRGVIAESVVVKTLDPIALEVVSLTPELRVDGCAPERGRSGSRAVFSSSRNLQPDHIKLVVDCTGITLPGTYTLPVKSVVPPGLVVMKYDSRPDHPGPPVRGGDSDGPRHRHRRGSR